MKKFSVLFVLLLFGCQPNDNMMLYDDVRDYQGVWRDSLFTVEKKFVEEFMVENNTMSYILSDVETHVLYDKQNGELQIGNENVIGWNCTSAITNKNIKTSWKVTNLSEYELSLFSEKQGHRHFNRVYRAALCDYSLNDTINELLQFNRFLPLSDSDVVNFFGNYNKVQSNEDFIYLVHHPIIDKIRFLRNEKNDSIYSFVITVVKDTSLIKNWRSIQNIVSSQFTKIRDIKGITEYCDAKLFEESSFIIGVDSLMHQITYSLLECYDYWPNVSKYLGKTLLDVRRNYDSCYVYRRKVLSESDLIEYNYQTQHDSVCRSISIMVDSAEIVRRCQVSLMGKYSIGQVAQILHLLNSKYTYMESGNDVYYYYSSKTNNNPEYEVRYDAKKREIQYLTK